MSLKATLERQLADVRDFPEPDVELEQYRTPERVAAHLLALADLQDDLDGRRVVDLGTGTGMLALGAALLDPARVIGIELDGSVLDVARLNEDALAPGRAVDWVQGDASSVPLRSGDWTVVANPPFGAHADNRHADRAFLETIADLGRVSYTIHNEGSSEFVEAFSMDNGGRVTHAYAVEFPLPRQFMHHESDRESIQAELFRIEWNKE